MTVGDRIKQARAEKGLSRPELAEESHIPYPTLAGLENGDQSSSTRLHAIAAVLGVNVRWLATGRGPKEGTPGFTDGADWADILGYAQAVGLGDGVEAEDYAITHKLKFRADSLARKRLNHRKLAVMYGRGDSMLPRIREGDAILFDTSDTSPKDEALFVIQTHGIAGNASSVKRCRHFGEDVYFDALNPEGDHHWRKPRKMDDRRHPITIIGRVRWLGSWED